MRQAETQFKTVFDSLCARFDGATYITPAQALGLLPGGRKNPLSAARRRIERGTFPFPLTRLGERSIVVSLADVARMIAGDAGVQDESAPTPAAEPLKRGRGRPRKSAAAQMEGGAA